MSNRSLPASDVSQEEVETLLLQMVADDQGAPLKSYQVNNNPNQARYSIHNIDFQNVFINAVNVADAYLALRQFILNELAGQTGPTDILAIDMMVPINSEPEVTAYDVANYIVDLITDPTSSPLWIREVPRVRLL